MDNKEMKPIYTTDDNLKCGVIIYKKSKYYMDYEDRDKIVNCKKGFVFDRETDTYPSFCYNYKRVSYLEFLFNYSQHNAFYNFKNSNQCDLRRCNVEIYHSYHKHVNQNYHVLEFINGHFSSLGQDANTMKNPLWRVQENGKEYILMYCEKDTIIKLCRESYQKILDYENTKNEGKKMTWYKHQNGYIMCSLNLYIHQVITDCHGNGRGTAGVSVDHIDQNPLNNSIENLRIATRKEQEQNSKGIKSGTKRERKHNAQDLPDGITNEMMGKYVCYYKDYADKEKKILREYFRVEKHPKLKKIWSTSKSCKMKIQEKLAQANKVVDDLEDDIYPEKNEPLLPKYVSLVVTREKPHLVFERRTEDKRLNVRMVLPDEYDLNEQLEIFNEKVKEKYEINL